MVKEELLEIGDVFYYGYKEPLKKFKDGYGYMGALAYSKDLEEVQCHMCGKFFKALRSNHTQKCSGLSLVEYRDKVGLARSTPLIGEGVRMTLVKNYKGCQKRYNAFGFKKLTKEQKDQAKRNTIKENKSRRGRKISLETKNKRGSCPDQLLDKIIRLEKELGHVPNKADFQRKYKGRFMGTIYETFGSWVKAVEKAGMKPQSVEKAEKYLLEALCAYMVEFYERNKRTPVSSDMARGLLPDGRVYRKHFPTINHARAVAGVPLLMQIRAGQYEEYTPTQEETERFRIESLEYQERMEV